MQVPFSSIASPLIALIYHARAAANPMSLTSVVVNYCPTLRRVFRRIIQRHSCCCRCCNWAVKYIETVGGRCGWTLSGCHSSSRQHTIDLIKPYILLVDDRSDWVVRRLQRGGDGDRFFPMVKSSIPRPAIYQTRLAHQSTTQLQASPIWRCRPILLT